MSEEIGPPTTGTALSASGGMESYRLLVQAALHWCDKFMVVISEQSICNSWVLAEVEWAIEKARPIVAVQFGGYDWRDFQLALGRSDSFVATAELDFRNDVEGMQRKLGQVLDALLIRHPRHRGYV